MRSRMLRDAAAGLALLCIAGAAMAAPAMPWAKSYDDAQAEAKKSGKLVMVDFYTDW